MMKKKFFITLFMILSVIAFAENWISLEEISFKCPQNVDIDYNPVNYNYYYSSFPKDSKKRGNNLLTVRVMNFDQFISYERSVWHTVPNSSDYDSFRQKILETNCWYENGPSETCFQEVYKNKDMVIAVSYDFSSLWYVNTIGSYTFAAFCEKNIYLFKLTFDKTTGNANDKILKQLDKFVHLVYPGVKPGDMGGEQNEGWKFNEGKSELDIYMALKKKNTGVKELEEFQTQFEAILNSIDSNLMVKTLDNIRVRKNADKKSDSIITINKGEKIKILRKASNTPETIDGIFDYWYQVCIFKGTLDKDGNPIQDELIGYCFGGYLDK